MQYSFGSGLIVLKYFKLKHLILVYENVKDYISGYKVNEPLSPIQEEDEFLRTSHEISEYHQVSNAVSGADEDDEEEEEEEEDVEINSKFKRIQTKKIRKTRVQKSLILFT